MNELFQPLTLRRLTIPNRIWMSPMMQFSSYPSGPETGAATDWHFQHFAARALGGAGLAMVEATAISPEGRSSRFDLGLWNDRQATSHRRIIKFLHDHKTAAGIQLVHAGRKAATGRPWENESTEDGMWQRVAPSAVPFGGLAAPKELTRAEIHALVRQFAHSARLANLAGFDVLELHGAHGYLIHQFLSPASNHRTDEYGGSLANRMRFAVEVVDAVRQEWPVDKPLFFRVSATDWLAGDADDERRGWTSSESVLLAKELKDHGVDLFDVSTGGIVPDAKIPVRPGYQVEFAEQIREEASIATAAVGLITDADHAARIVSSGQADAVFLARELLRNPYWAQQAAEHLGEPARYPHQYSRAFSRPVQTALSRS
ncbi:NADH:flavin oxidoreductase/NADH oxidase [Arthrobacter sp. SLBN-112]|uniref:NADH:flavin oxidoreductase/NADH oxidase n=1 Tax=Arthrobacter sp. SLBN-112 TaxID=2768452 RepID=UPI0027B247B5|nr:NADH:flavin oxidoreductase/NADH oxidase [Arthrobacter sp. SLBN-112]MDQ0799692.1 2,4-dienoyl-CoA reductase-like NADH-dependent reductase (Old Yellow Enzyme family) [Arthrobacter sp. SLBN-112]